MTREKLEARLDGLRGGLAQLDAEMERLKANRQATDGAIQEVRYWLAQLPAPERPA